MKKLLLALMGTVMVAGCAMAQTSNVSTYGKHEKPTNYVTLHKGDVSLGAFVSVFNRNDVKIQTGINVKYFISDSWALRGNLRFGRDFANGTDPQYIYTEDENDMGYEYDEPTEDDNLKYTIRKSTFMVNIGAEHRHKLSNRFFGYYGLDLAMGGYGEINRTRKDGDVISLTKRNRSFDVELLPFMGVECFLGPKISLSTEFGYDFLFKFYSKDKMVENDKTEKIPQYNNIASHIDFGNMTFATLRFAYYF